MNIDERDLWTKALLAELEGLADLWATFRERHANAEIPPQAPFCAGLETCSEQIRETVARARRLASEDWDLARPAIQARLSDA